MRNSHTVKLILIEGLLAAMMAETMKNFNAPKKNHVAEERNFFVTEK